MPVAYVSLGNVIENTGTVIVIFERFDVSIAGQPVDVPERQIEMFRGDDHVVEFTVKNAAGNPIDLSLSAIWFSVKKNVNLETALVLKRNSLAGGGDGEILVIDPDNGKFNVILVPTDTEDLDAEILYQYDVQITYLGKRLTIVKDRYYLKQDITTVD